MATLTTLVPTSDVAAGGWTTTPLWSKVDEPLGSPDGSDILGTTGGTTTACRLALSDVDSDFASMTTITISVRVGGEVATPDDTFDLRVRVVKSDGTTAMTSWYELLAVNVSTTDQNYTSGDVLIAAGSSATKAEWDAAQVQIEGHGFNQEMGPDGNRIHFQLVNIDGTYSQVTWPVAPQRLYERRPRGNFHNATHY